MLDTILSFNLDILYFFNTLPREIHITAHFLGFSLYPMVLFVLYLTYKENKNLEYKTLLSLVFAYIASLIIKYSLQIPRPYEYLDNIIITETSSNSSFPSSHTTVAFAASEISPKYVNLLRVWALMIGLSRIVLGMHYLTDIIAGAILGILISRLFSKWDMAYSFARSGKKSK